MEFMSSERLCELRRGDFPTAIAPMGVNGFEKQQLGFQSGLLMSNSTRKITLLFEGKTLQTIEEIGLEGARRLLGEVTRSVEISTPYIGSDWEYLADDDSTRD
jgi:hypothetical protein